MFCTRYYFINHISYILQNSHKLIAKDRDMTESSFILSIKTTNAPPREA